MPLISSDLNSEFRRVRAGQPQAAAPKEMTRPKFALPQSSALFNARTAANFRKQAQGMPGVGGSNVANSSPEVRNPLLNLINFYLPYDRRSLNQWIRYYDTFHPVVGNCIDLHGEFPISDFDFIGLESAYLEIYEDWKEKVDLLTWMFEASREYEVMGESFTFWNWDDDEKEWVGFVHLNPDLLEVKSIDWGTTRKSVYTYQPPAELMELVRNREDNRVMELMEELDPVVHEAISAGQPIPLSAYNITEILHKANPSDSRGRANLLRILKELLYEDKLREAQYAIADRQITPVQIWKLGNTQAGYMPTDADLADFRDLILNSAHDPLFTIISHDAIGLDLVGFTGKLLPIIPEFDWVEKRILTGLFASKAITLGEGPTYSGAVVAMKALQGRYATKRERFKRLVTKKLCDGIAKARKLVVRTKAELDHKIRMDGKSNGKGPKPAIPEMRWHFDLDLTDERQLKTYLLQLQSKGVIPMKTVCEVLRLDYDKVKKALKDEEGTVFDSVYQKIRAKKAEESGKAEGTEDLGGDLPAPEVGGEEAGGGAGEETTESAETEAPPAEAVPEGGGAP